MTTPADELRTAAAKLRALTVVATPGPWTQTGIGDFGWTVSSPSSALVDTVDSEEGRADADYIAAMHPGVGKALARLLDLEETYLVGMPENESLAHVRAALAVARALNGGEQQ